MKYHIQRKLRMGEMHESHVKLCMQENNENCKTTIEESQGKKLDITCKMAHNMKPLAS